MALVPVEFIGKARALQKKLTADDANVMAQANRLLFGLRGRTNNHQSLGPGAYSKFAAMWRALPANGRIELSIAAEPKKLTIRETRAIGGRFRFTDWTDDAREWAIVLTDLALFVRPRHFECHHIHAAHVCQHALARRFERGEPSEQSVLADLVDLAKGCPAILTEGGDFSHAAPPFGFWAGSVIDLAIGQTQVRVAGVRTFKPAG